MKYDDEKPMMALFPAKATLEVGKVLTYGANKYSVENWKTTDNFDLRYLSAALRHIFAHISGETHDEESKLLHLAHAACSMLFLLEKKIGDEEKRMGEYNSEKYLQGHEGVGGWRD